MRISAPAAGNCLLIVLALWLTINPAYAQSTESAEERAELQRLLADRALLSTATLAASFGTVPRHRFISGPPQAFSYKNSPAPLGAGHFLPSPEEYARMIAAAGDLAGTRVLVAGPDSGYLAALVSRLAGSVVQIEFSASRAADFVALFQELNYTNIEVRSGADRISEDSAERFDRILLAYGTEFIPITLIARLGSTGRLIGVLSYQRGEQLLMEYRRIRNGASIRVLGRVFFPTDLKM